MKLRITSTASQFISLSALMLTLTGCVFGDNKQFFEAGILPQQISPLPLAPVISSPTPSPTATPGPTATPVATTTPTAASPIARDDGPYEIAINQTLTLQTSELLQNDSDPNGLPIHFNTYSAATSGTLSSVGNTLTFQPALNFVGAVTFSYTIANSLNLTAQATVTINVRAPATEVLYGESASNLYRYDPLTHVSTWIANFKLANGSSVDIYDIAITGNGLMYGVDGSHLYYINASTGICTLVPTTGLGAFGNINGLTALSDGRLVISGNGITIYDIATHALTTLLAAGNYTSSGDIIALPDGYLYMAASTNGNDRLIRIDPATGATANLGSLGRTGVYGLGYAYNVFYGFDSNGDVFNIDPATAATTHVMSSGVNWFGATTNPVLW